MIVCQEVRQFAMCTALSLLGLTCLGDLNFTSEGDVRWTENKGVWQSGDLRNMVGFGGHAATSVLNLEVTAPCTVTFGASYFGQQVFIGNLSFQVDGVPYDNLDCGFELNVVNSIPVHGSGKKTLQWRVYSDYAMNKEEFYMRIANVAVAAAPSSVSVTFDMNGGTGSPTSAAYSPTGPYGSLPKPIRDGCAFGGWYTARFGGEEVKEGDAVRFDVTTLYARWLVPVDEAIVKTGDIAIDDQVEGYGWVGQLDESEPGKSVAAVGKSGALIVKVSGCGVLTFRWRTVGGGGCDLDDESGKTLASVMADVIDEEEGTHRLLPQDGEWKEERVTLSEDGEHELVFHGWFLPGCERQAVLLDDLSWTRGDPSGDEPEARISALRIEAGWATISVTNTASSLKYGLSMADDVKKIHTETNVVGSFKTGVGIAPLTWVVDVSGHPQGFFKLLSKSAQDE